MTLLLLQITAVLLVALLCGALTKRLGQSRVIGEIIGGILIGPSFFGRYWPHAAATLFPPASLAAFDILSTLGLILFLFLIGAELDYAHIRRQRFTATFASMLSMVLPFGLAILFSHAIRVRFSNTGRGGLVFALFLGISMSITAFPVLARMLEERGLQSTPLGATALLCAAVDDVSAWSLLAFAMALLPSTKVTQTMGHRFMELGVYLFVMIGVVRPLGSLFARRARSKELHYEVLAVIVAVVFASAAVTDAIGIHPLFGAFLAGLCFPRLPQWQTAIRERLNVVVSILLLPLFFALTGMRTRLDLLSGEQVWLWTLLILTLAVIGKMGGAILGSRLTGQGWRNALALGALLNTRGLVELVVLNIAYNAHVFSPTLFSMMVVMALVTTAMTNPLLDLLSIANHSKKQAIATVKAPVSATNGAAP